MWLYIWVVSHKFSTGYSFGGWEKWVNISKSNRYNSCVYMRVTDGYLAWGLKLVYATPPRISIHRSSQCGKPMLSTILTVSSIYPMTIQIHSKSQSFRWFIHGNPAMLERVEQLILNHGLTFFKYHAAQRRPEKHYFFPGEEFSHARCDDFLEHPKGYPEIN